ncbi:MAG: CYTH domain-containing protein [Clostridiales bacterium]|nr:CYTH domain-containing protein [Clostridiales bacterium]
MEIERKYLINRLPEFIDTVGGIDYEQAYLCSEPVVRVRREGEEYWMTYKSKGLMIREEYNLPLTKESYYHLLSKADSQIIHKTRYFIPLDEKHVAELDIYHDFLSPLITCEVEFSDKEDAETFISPEWFGPEVTFDSRYQNNRLAFISREELMSLL